MDYNEYCQGTPENRKDFFFENLSPTNRTPEYYVNWDKVVSNTRQLELGLNTLNYLIGKKEIREEAKELFLTQPNLLKIVPSLIASRDTKLDILLFDDVDMDFTKIDFSNINVGNIDEYLNFMEDSGLFNFLQNNANKSLVDYVFGVEVGLDSNARKNRSGTTMEGIVEKYVEKTCIKLGYNFKTQATSKWIHENWGVLVPVDKSARRFDVAVYDKEKNKVYVIETNFYGGGGSKLKSVCGEFITLNSLIKKSEDNVKFIWITDGVGWKTARLPMSEAFSIIDNIFNLMMLKNDFLFDMFNY
ncbi:MULTISPECIES: type II restriction endonuclease [Enterococcus]|uniref:type II restriction endonuclease n=1 Tax=Enterococcus TaxID=1350 RepID=UPI000CF1416E|nr:type II restriction endonuclease [Enterococcus faecalis]BDH64570.1 type II restriction endonuclease LlaDCHI [Enterococcus sp. PLM3]EGO2797910.1 restriction endonuclease [Enterococcus faecalis]EGO2829021.1 restriction endonuclease [Enterococcus faecalis]EGO5138160.1 restriction endonuclease [Enterococcus faecalis]EGO6040680.1 restriction endonuclease [Enterococcus faecalis]